MQRSKQRRYSITSSARASTVAGQIKAQRLRRGQVHRAGHDD
jgi:hypothetical protein